MAEGGNHGHTAASPRDGDVQATLTAPLVQRAELSMVKTAARVFAGADGKDNRVSLIALYPLEVFHEESLWCGLVEDIVKVWSFVDGLLNRGLHPTSVLDA